MSERQVNGDNAAADILARGMQFQNDEIATLKAEVSAEKNERTSAEFREASARSDATHAERFIEEKGMFVEFVKARGVWREKGEI